MRSALVLAALPLALACKQPIEAPTELSELSHYLFAEWENEDPEVMEAGLVNLSDWIGEQDLDAARADRTYGITPLPNALTKDLVNHGRESRFAPAVGVVFQSAFSAVDHSSHIPNEDQKPLEPNSPNKYIRTIIEGDAEAWRGQDEAFIRSDNDIERSNAIMTVEHPLRKDWRWVEMEDGAMAVAGKSWMPDVAVGEQENTYLYQGYSIDVFVPDGDGTCVRWQVTWQETEMSGVSQDTIMGTLGYGMEQVFNRQDQFLEENPP